MRLRGEGSRLLAAGVRRRRRWSRAQLAEDLTLVGLAVDGLETHGGDAVLDLDVTTNRVDCMNVYGVAREVSVALRRAAAPARRLASPRPGRRPRRPSTSRSRRPTCARASARACSTCASVLRRPGCATGWSRWACGPINNVVDLTNYVMMEMGHPSHAFDLARIPGGEADRALGARGRAPDDARRRGARAGGRGTAWWRDPTAPLALAGIMGGASSEVSDDDARRWRWRRRTGTRCPSGARAKALGMHTEASHRFERGRGPRGHRRRHRAHRPPAAARSAPAARARASSTATPAPRAARDGRRCGSPRVDARAGQRRCPRGRARAILTGLGFERQEGRRAGDVRGADAGAATSRARSTSSRRSAGTTGSSKHPVHGPARRADAEGLRPWQERERAPARAAGRRRA